MSDGSGVKSSVTIAASIDSLQLSCEADAGSTASGRRLALFTASVPLFDGGGAAVTTVNRDSWMSFGPAQPLPFQCTVYSPGERGVASSNHENALSLDAPRNRDARRILNDEVSVVDGARWKRGHRCRHRCVLQRRELRFPACRDACARTPWEEGMKTKHDGGHEKQGRARIHGAPASNHCASRQ